jgi:copper chaperone CopZ
MRVSSLLDDAGFEDVTYHDASQSFKVDLNEGDLKALEKLILYSPYEIEEVKEIKSYSTLVVSDIHCQKCVESISKALVEAEYPQFKIELETKEVQFSKQYATSEIKRVIEEAGYTVED